MDIQNNTILVTGGSSGIGIELAKRFSAIGNTVIICGRSQEALDAAQEKNPGFNTFVCDVSDALSVEHLREHVVDKFPALNVVINCAGIMRKINLHDPIDDLTDVTREIETNLKGTIWINQAFLPHLKTQPKAAVINVSSGLAFVPMAIAPIYSATKSAIHSYTMALRLQMKKTSVQIFELAPPGTDTPLFSGDFSKEDVGGITPMPVEKMVDIAMKGLAKNVLEIRPGLSNVLKMGSRIAPNFITAQLGKSVDAMLTTVN